MTNPFFNADGSPAQSSQGSSAVMRTEFANVAAAFDKMPLLTANTAVVVNGAGTALTNTTGSLALAGAFATTGAFSTTFAQQGNATLILPAANETLVGRATTDTLTNKTLTAPNIAGGAFSGTISGAHTYSGALTLSAALTYGGVALTNSVTGTGKMVLSASATLTGTTTFDGQAVSLAAIFNSTHTDGVLTRFRDSGADVGFIGDARAVISGSLPLGSFAVAASPGGDMYVSAPTGQALRLGTGIRGSLTNKVGAGTYFWDNSQFFPDPDNTLTLGTSSQRWTTVYATTGTINTSDEREKEWRGALTVTEIAAAGEILKSAGGFKFLSAIAKKGDAARVHIGFKAQQVRDILIAHGLEATSYAFLCFDQWEAAPADDADAIPEKPAGNRWGLRPDELTHFLMAAVDARLSALEIKSE